MFVFEMFEPSLIMRLRSVCLVLSVHSLTGSSLFRPLSLFCNESRWEESVSLPQLLAPLVSLWF